MANWYKYIAIFSVFVLILFGFVIRSNLRRVSVAPSLSVAFVGVTNNPARQWTPTRIEVCQGATGLCALFLVRNVASNHSIWFKTASIEQKTSTGWQTFLPSGTSWSGVEGSVWSPGYGCLYAVGWPPGVPTNATWRLQVGTGPGPSGLQLLVNQRIRREIFHSGGQDAIVPSTEVKQ
jgi:hypothetical protein